MLGPNRIIIYLIVTCLGLFTFSLYAKSPSIKKLHPQGAAIASASPYATKEGLRILRMGGNAFDAAVAVSAVLAVTEPYHSGLGGGGFWLLHDEKKKQDVFLDGREVAPKSSTQNMFQNLPNTASRFGPLAAAIPGEPAAIVFLAKRYGRLPLTETLKTAIHLAQYGFPVDNHYLSFLTRKSVIDVINQFPESKEQFLINGKIPKVGDLLKQPNLAKTLRQLSIHGKAGFYKGQVAKSMVKAVNRAGGDWQLSDLTDYKVKIRKPLTSYYQGVKIITAPPPSAGGVALITMLNILSNYQLNLLPLVSQYHLIIEAMRLSYWDRNQYLGDPDYIKVPLKKLLSKEHIQFLNNYIRKNQATPSKSLTQPSVLFADSGFNTTHFSIIDSEGNYVSATLSINFLFGSGFVAGDTGVLLNDEMDDFATHIGQKNIFGLVGGWPNRIQPGKRPLSSMAPTFLVGQQRIGIIGTPGGSRIPTMILLATLAFIDAKTPITQVSLPRFHHQYLPDVVYYEQDAFSRDAQEKLIAMGYELKKVTQTYGGASATFGDMQAVLWDKKNNWLYAASDPRHIGLAVVEPKFNKEN